MGLLKDIITKLIIAGIILGLIYIIILTGWKGLLGMFVGITLGTFGSAFLYYSPKSPLPYLEKIFTKGDD